MDEQAYITLTKIYELLNKEDPTERDLERVRGMLETLLDIYAPEPEEQDHPKERVFKLPGF